MYTTLVMSETVTTSWWGTARASDAFVVLLAASALWYKVLLKEYYAGYYTPARLTFPRAIAGILAFGLIASALAVQLPDRVSEAVLYSALVGVTIYGTANLMLLSQSGKWGWGPTMVDMLFGTVVCVAASMAIYLVFHGRGVGRGR